MMLRSLIACAALSALPVQASPFRPLPGRSSPTSAASIPTCPMRGTMTNDQAGGAKAGGIANLPHAMGRSFATLDEYLTHLRCNMAPIDRPWWREIRPGVYEQVKRMPEGKAEVASRAELARRFGFAY